MLKQFSEKFVDSLVKKRGSLVLTPEYQEEVLSRAKRVRSCDYVAPFTIKNGVTNSAGLVTRANWIFILTNSACYWENMAVSDFPKIAVNFPYYEPKTPFNTRVQDWGAVPSNLVFGREALTGQMQHFEEYKNLYYMLDQRFVIQVDIKANAGQYGRGAVLLSGLEVDLNEV